MVRYNCKNCNFRFELAKEQAPLRCPYCNAKASVAREQTAEELLDEIKDIE